VTERAFASFPSLATALLALIAAVSPAAAQDISINFGQRGGLTERVIQLIA
jgi:hypothetical protein